MDRRCAGALIALAACIATTAAAPTASNQTALDLYEGPSEGCYYNFQHYGEGDRIMTNEPCLNCTCHNRMLMCYLRVCPFTKPIGQDCSVEKRADQCCPIVTCPDVPVDLLTSTSTSSPSEYGETGLGKLDRYGCSINGKYFPEGSKVPPSPNKPCEHCYCIRNMTTCVMQECTLHVDGCTPIYRKDVCCPVRYSCDHPEDEIPLLDDMTTTVRPTPGFLLTTTTVAPVTQMTQDCVHDDKIFADGALIKTEKACEHCYCMKGDIVCVVQECGTPMENEGKNCTSMPPREGQCCPDTYICEGDEMTTETKPDVATVTPFEDAITTLSPPRRVSVEGSGYRSETDEPSTDVPLIEPDIEGSGEDHPPFKPTDASDMLLPENETSPPLIVTDQVEITDHYSPSTTVIPVSEQEMTEKTTTDADKGENTVPSGDVEKDTSDASAQATTSPITEITTTMVEAEKESSVDAKTTALPELDTSVKDKTTLHDEITATEPAFIAESTTPEHELHISPDSLGTSEAEVAETTIPSRRKEDDEITPKETTTLKHLEESTTKASDLIAPDIVATESTTPPFVEQEVQTATTQVTEEDKEGKEPSTESHLVLTTESDVIKEATQSTTTVQPEIATEFTTLSKVDIPDTTSVNPNENEIDEEPYPTLAPGRIPGEGDCLLDGVTYSHESIVPSSSNCHTGCRCVSSIVKCEPIVCSPPPDYMDNCQPMYDSPESCCPTYVCDHPRETVPPQSHSQMAGTESPIPTPTIECDGDQCIIVKDKEGAAPSCTSEGCTADSSKKPDDCGPQGCREHENKPEEAPPAKPVEECTGDSCSSSPEHCASGNCKEAIPKDQTCNNENGCEIPVIQTCQGNDCAIQPDVTAPKDDSKPCDSPDGCKDQSCNNENGCEIPVIQTCQGNDCAVQPDVTASKNISTHCDNTESCKDIQVPDEAPDCKGESCVSELPTQPSPQEAQDCKDGNDCGQIPSIGECSEEECKKQQVPEINKPSPSDCIGAECIQQQDNVQYITDVPEVSTGSVPRFTEPEEIETKSEEPVTDLPKTTAFEKEIDLSGTTKASIPDKEEELSTTTQYVGIDNKKEIETPSPATESPEIVTLGPEGQQEESSTVSAKTETTTVSLDDTTKVKEILSEITPAVSEMTTTEIPSLTDKDTKEITTESIMKPTHDEHPELPEDAAKDKDTIDITTTEASIYGTSPEINKGTITSLEMQTLAPESLDRDGHEKPTKEPEYVQDTEATTIKAEPESITPSPLLDKFGKPEDDATKPAAEESTDRYTSAPEYITEKVDVEPVQEQEPQGAQTTPESYNTETTTPKSLEIASAETQTTSPEDKDKKTAELPVSTSTPEESITSKPDDFKQTAGDMSLPDTTEEAETKIPEFLVDEATSRPESPLDLETPSPELNVTPSDESITIIPVHDITGEPESQTETSKPLVTLPQETSPAESDIDRNEQTQSPIIVDVQTQTPMSIVKDHGYDEVASTVTSEPAITTEHITKEPESPESVQSTEPTEKPAKTPSEEPVSDTEKIPTLSDEKQTPASTEPSVGDLGTSAVMVEVPSTKQPMPESDKSTISETETSTDSLLVSVPIISESISSEPSVTEVAIPESSVPQKETTERTHITSIPNDDNETKSPIPATESSGNKPIAEGEEIITPVQVQPDDTEDIAELPELIIHEHPTEASSTEKESEQAPTEETDIEPQENIPEKETPDAPQDTVTVAIETPESVSQRETTVEPEQESVTKAPETFQPETTESKLDDELPHTPESPSTEPQKEVTETPELQAATNLPQATTTDAQKEVTETPVIQDTVTSAPKLSETEPQETITESQTPLAETDVFITQPHKYTTDAPLSYDIVTNPSDSSDTATEPHRESSVMPEKDPEMEPHKETTKIQDDTTTLPEISLTESHKEAIETPELQETTTKTADISSDKSDKEAVEEPKPQDAVTISPELSATDTQEDTTKGPEITDVATNIPEIPETTVAPVAQDLTTSAPEVPITESIPVKDTNVPMIEDKITTVPEISVSEPPKEGTEAPTHDDSLSDVPEVHTIGPLKEITQAPALEDTQAPESQDAATSAPELPESEPTKETIELPESQAGSTIPETAQTEPKKEITEMPETQGITDAPEISTDTKVPGIIVTESHKDVTNAPETQDVATNAPEIPTVSENEVTEKQETSEKPITEPYNVPTEESEVFTTESQKFATEISPAVVTSVPEMLSTKSDKEITEEPGQEVPTKAPEQVETEPKPSITEKDEVITEPPFKVTTKLDEHTQSEPQEFVTSTELSKIESETSLPTYDAPVEPDTRVTESPTTESPDKITDSDVETEKPAPSVAAAEKKPHEGQDIDIETPFAEPAQTESPISEPIEPETEAPEFDATATPESPVTGKQDSRQTEPTSSPVEEDFTKAPETLESQDKTTKISEEPDQTSETKETTPYLVILEEHTHKTLSPDEETSTSPSDIPSKEYEPSTPEISIDKVTELAPSVEPEYTQTTSPEKSTEPSPASEEITTISPLAGTVDSDKPQIVESNEISTSAPTTGEEPIETEKPLAPSVETEKEVVASEKPQETILPEEELILATTKATTIKAEEESTTLSPLLDKFGKPEDGATKPAPEPEKPRPDVAEEAPKPGINEVQPTEESLPPEEDGHFPPSGTSGYGQEPDYGEEDSFGPGTCRYGGKVYVSAQQIPRDDPCDFCFCFRSDIICLQQSCPPPIHGCHEEPIQGFCCPRYECPVSMATTLNVTTTTTTTTTTLPPHFLPHAYKGAAQRRGCQIKGHTYKVGEVVRASSGPCLHCTCGGDGQMKCDPKVCTPEPMLRQMIAAAVSAKRRR